MTSWKQQVNQQKESVAHPKPFYLCLWIMHNMSVALQVNYEVKLCIVDKDCIVCSFVSN